MMTKTTIWIPNSIGQWRYRYEQFPQQLKNTPVYYVRKNTKNSFSSYIVRLNRS